MSIRPFDWRDLPALHHHRKNSIFLYSAQALTRGPGLFKGTLLSCITPAMGIFTSVAPKNGSTGTVIIGQIFHIAGSPFAQLTFLAPDTALNSPAVLALLDHLASKAG